jgi:hypothetical protein
MNGSWLDLLWPFNRRLGLLTAAVLIALLVAGHALPALAVLGVYAVLVLLANGRSMWLFRLLRTTGDWWRVGRGRVVLYHPPRRMDGPIVRAVLRCCETQLDSLEKRFGFRLDRVVIFLFEAGRDVEAVFRDPCGGRALPHADAILINQHDDLVEIIRHELTHLFAARWQMAAPPLLEEGLATWLQGTWGGVPVDRLAPQLLQDWPQSLKALLDRAYFFGPANRGACYTLAASFTGFLIRHHGWDRYRSIYKASQALGPAGALRKYLGRTVEELDHLWRAELSEPFGVRGHTEPPVV